MLTGVSAARVAGAEDRWKVNIDCPALAQEDRARVEVRLLVELAQLKALPGQIVLECTLDSVRGEWLEGGEVQGRRSVSRSDQDDTTELLLWLASMLVEVRGDSLPVEAPAAALPVEKQADDSPLGELSTGPADDPAVPAIPRGEPLAERDSSGADGENLAQGRGAKPLKERSNATRKPKARSTWGVDAGVAYEHWGSTLAGGLGGRAGAEWLHSSGFGATASFGVLWGVGSAQGFKVTDYVLSSAVLWAPSARVRIGLGPVLSVLHISSPGTQQQAPSSSDAATGGGEIVIRALWPDAGFGGWVQVGARGLFEQRDVLLDGKETIVSIPSWQGLVALGVRWGM